MLAKKLARHGAPFCGTSAMLSQSLAPASVSTALVAATVQMATPALAGKMVVSAAISAPVAALTEGVMKAMLLTKLKTAVAVMVVLAITGLAAGHVILQGQAVQPRAGQESNNTPQAPEAQQTDQEKHSKDDMARLQGTWRTVKGENNGVPFSFAFLPPKDGSLTTFTGDKWTSDFGTGYTFKLDPVSKPKSMDLHPLEDSEKTLLGIYRFNGDDLTICYCNDGKQKRPLGFENYWRAESHTILLVLKRQKDKAEKPLKKDKNYKSDAQEAAARDPAARQAPVAVIVGDTPITRGDLGDYLLLRLSPEQLQRYINLRILEHSARAKGLAVTDQEVEAAYAADRKASNDPRGFDEAVRQRHQTLAARKEDVIRPRLLLEKLCRERVHVTEQDLRNAYQARYGEKVECRMILWPAAEKEKAEHLYPLLREN
jgi:uncharacterized protein (TIGR03067 family)